MSINQSKIKKGRGVVSNPKNRFESSGLESEYDFIDGEQSNKTTFLEVFPKSIVNKVTSPNVGMEYSLNPYQGCEHGCTYCYARPTHEYWGYSSGLDFENKILVKKNAPDLLIETFERKNWKPAPIVLSGNTDCYQPCEKEFRITRRLLKVCLQYRNPVSIISKNVLLERDLDLIEDLSKLNLIVVNLSITSLDEVLRRKLEPRTATSQRKFNLIKTLRELTIPVNVLASPIIPGLNDHELMSIVKKASESGANNVHYQLVRLKGQNPTLFKEWLEVHYPDRVAKVMNQLAETNQLGEGKERSNLRKEGVVALAIQRQFEIARNRYFKNRQRIKLDTTLFRRPPKHGQMTLF